MRKIGRQGATPTLVGVLEELDIVRAMCNIRFRALDAILNGVVN